MKQCKTSRRSSTRGIGLGMGQGQSPCSTFCSPRTVSVCHPFLAQVRLGMPRGYLRVLWYQPEGDHGFHWPGTVYLQTRPHKGLLASPRRSCLQAQNCFRDAIGKIPVHSDAIWPGWRSSCFPAHDEYHPGPYTILCLCLYRWCSHIQQNLGGACPTPHHRFYSVERSKTHCQREEVWTLNEIMFLPWACSRLWPGETRTGKSLSHQLLPPTSNQKGCSIILRLSRVLQTVYPQQQHLCQT